MACPSYCSYEQSLLELFHTYIPTTGMESVLVILLDRNGADHAQLYMQESTGFNGRGIGLSPFP